MRLLLGGLPAAESGESIRDFSAHAVPPRLGRLRRDHSADRNTCCIIWRATPTASRSPMVSTRRCDRYSRVVSMEGLCSSQQTPRDDPQPRGVSPPISPAHPALRTPQSVTSVYSPTGAGCTAPSLQDALTRTSGTVQSTSSTASGSWQCPCCQGPMRLVERLTANQLHRSQSSPVGRLDSS